ncbi:uncharacterized protein LOC119097959 [Pollicipes pollicipes]|uniref:uncharacterized protein LOC119097959 n=1 Tax=Pollicipes pollicipes TaxID=41117 RepID=UPI001884DB96|nr:uncharacterized protein LOC119097959 [Pollicipes pollicipes]
MKRRSRMALLINYSWIVAVLLVFSLTHSSHALTVEAPFSWKGLRGSVSLEQESPDHNVTITVDVTVMEEEANGTYRLQVNQFPVDYSRDDYCASAHLGKRFNKLAGLDDIELPSDGVVTMETDEISLFGADTPLGRSISLDGPRTVCSTIQAPSLEYLVAEARFQTPVAGTVFFRQYRINGTQHTGVLTDIAHSGSTKPTSSEHSWSIMVTDVLDTASDEMRGSCNFLQLVYDPTSADAARCSDDTPQFCKAGDLLHRLGKVKVTGRRSRFSKQFWSSDTLELPPLNGYRSAYLVLYEEAYPDSILACAKLRLVRPRTARAFLSYDGVRGVVGLSQRSRFEPTQLLLNISGLAGRAATFGIHTLPVPPRDGRDASPCARVANVYNPTEVDAALTEPAGAATHDQYPLGDISGKHGRLTGLDSFESAVTDFRLPLWGPRSVVGRSLVFTTAEEEEKEQGAPNKPWICANLQDTRKMVTAAAVFRFPLGGRVLFYQPEDEPEEDTTVLVEGLLFNDGSMNGSDWHRWYVNELVPGADFRNWSGRCLSAGDHFNPYSVNVKSRLYDRSCGPEDMGNCEVADMVGKHGTLKLAALRRKLNETRRMWTDTNLPLSGASSIIGHSLVIHDDNGPRARGDRLACVEIIRLFRYKGVVKEWAYNGDKKGAISGKVEFIQESPYSITNTETDLMGLEGIAGGYHIHLVPVHRDNEFPCHNIALGGHYNPYKLNPATSPPPGYGSSDQYEMGDMSGKYGMLTNQSAVERFNNDTNLQLFGPQTVLGRSVVIHRAGDNSRWACGNILWGYSSSEARQVTAIASFHHPKGYAWGYIRFSQLVYHTGGRSETVIELNLRHPGANDRNVTSNHNWAIFVNPVGHDAAVQFFTSRCTAGGYRWNPDFIHLANPNAHDFYNEECSPETPLRCEIGDLGGRLGTINLGQKRVVMSDPNLPLDGDFWHSAIGKSVIIFEANRGSNRYACANIEPDFDIIKRVSIRKLPKFVASQFIHAVRQVLQAPEWFIFIDEQETLEIKLGKMRPQAQKLQYDFNRLFSFGRVDGPTIFIPGYFNSARKNTVPYDLCGALDPEDTERYQDLQGNAFKLPDFFGSSRGRMAAPSLVIGVALAAMYRLLV